MIPTHCPFCNLLLEELFAQGEDTNNWVCPTRLGPNNYYWHYAICLDHDEKWDGHVLTYERIHLGTKGSASRLTFLPQILLASTKTGRFSYPQSRSMSRTQKPSLTNLNF